MTPPCPDVARCLLAGLTPCQRRAAIVKANGLHARLHVRGHGRTFAFTTGACATRYSPRLRDPIRPPGSWPHLPAPSVTFLTCGYAEPSGILSKLACELVANAVCHGETPIWVRLSADGGGLRVEVHDGGAGRPVRKHPGSGDECGRGLEVLDGLIELYGGERGVISDPDGPGKTVYVVLALAGPPSGAR